MNSAQNASFEDRVPFLTYGLLVVHVVVVFAHQLPDVAANGGPLDKYLPLLRPYLTFYHGGIYQAVVAIAVLWQFGRELEARIGPSQYGLLYLLCAAVGTLVGVAFFEAPFDRGTIIHAGSSGLIGAVLIHFRGREVEGYVDDWTLTGRTRRRVPLAVLLVLWLVAMVVLAVGAIDQSPSELGLDEGISGGTIWWGDVAAFVLGGILIILLGTFSMPTSRPDKTA